MATVMIMTTTMTGTTVRPTIHRTIHGILTTGIIPFIRTRPGVIEIGGPGGKVSSGLWSV